MNENYWKDAYQDTWGKSSKREKRLMTYILRLPIPEMGFAP